MKGLKNLNNNNSKCYIIAEMSANHGGKFEKAVEIIHAAKEAGADCIKIQTYTPDTITIDCDNEYFTINEGSWKGETLYSLYKKAYTPWQWQDRLKKEADKIGIDFLSTPFDKTAVDFLEDIEVEAYKIASFEVVDIPLIKYIASKGKPIIMSTGMATLDEITEAVNTIRKEGNNKIFILKCSSAYPSIPENMNLNTMIDMKKNFNVPVGLSDHSLGSIAATTAVAMGAKIIEKHFCLSREDDTADSFFSMEPNEFKEMVHNIRLAERAMGKINYEISEKEKISRSHRKSIFVVRDIKKGEKLTRENIRVIRPAQGLEPKYYEQVLGKVSKTDIKKGTPFTKDIISIEGD
ncbi:pseudaminic acid synthase [Dethiothermospora halolimnae]|uniref:pseudaminic acid synthase n=1 Tax=Dethiothermospora halolimnae TaxID=3114390 RepID=UPI003CCC2DB2